MNFDLRKRFTKAIYEAINYHNYNKLRPPFGGQMTTTDNE